MIEGTNEHVERNERSVPAWSITPFSTPLSVGGGSSEITVPGNVEATDALGSSLPIRVSPTAEKLLKQWAGESIKELSRRARAADSSPWPTDHEPVSPDESPLVVVSAGEPTDSGHDVGPDNFERESVPEVAGSSQLSKPERTAASFNVSEECSDGQEPMTADEAADYGNIRFPYEDGDFTEDYDGRKRVRAAFNDPSFRALSFEDQIEARGFGFKGDVDIPYSDGYSDRFGNPIGEQYLVGLTFKASWRQPEETEQQV